MANIFTTKPLQIDTTMVSGFNAQIGGNGKPISAYKVEWFNPAAAGDTFSITELVSGRILHQGQCESNSQSQVWDFARPLVLPRSSDWKVTISSGKLLIWY